MLQAFGQAFMLQSNLKWCVCWKTNEKTKKKQNSRKMELKKPEVKFMGYIICKNGLKGQILIKSKL